MCGIAGIASLSGGHGNSADLQLRVDDMLEHLEHRGPDEQGSGHQDGVAIGNVRLKIVGGDSGSQPVVDDGEALVFNGEIYNYRELAKQYNVPPEVDSDTSVLFAALRQDGMQALSRLNGMFALCFVTKDSIYVVRDRFGEKPLYYSIYQNSLYFASEIKGLLGHVPVELELPRLYAATETAIRAQTVFRNILQLEPGSYLKIDRNTKHYSLHRYYQYVPSGEVSADWQEQVHEFRALVKDAIDLRVPKDIDYGVYVSGGLDSSIIALSSWPQVMMTYVPGSLFIPSEERYADLIARARPDAKYLRVAPEPRQALQDLVTTIYANDGPTTTLAAYSQLLMARCAKDNGLRVVLSGMGPDEFMGGYARHAIALMSAEDLHPDIRGQYQPLISKKGSTSDVSAAYANIVSRQDQTDSAFARTIDSIFETYQDPMVAISVCDALISLPPLMTTDDRMNMAFGVESRSPFLDYRVVEYALGLPIDSKIRGKGNELSMKHILREAFKDLLPEPIYNRKDKIGYSSHINDMLKGEWRPMVEGSIWLLQTNYPDEPYYQNAQGQRDNFSRWGYQMLQLAISHMLFCEHLSIPEVVEKLEDMARLSVLPTSRESLV